MPASFAVGAIVSRSGPTLPVAPAAASVWHAPQPDDLKTAAAFTGPPAPALSCFIHASNAAAGITCADERMIAWPRPQSSVQMTGKVPVRVGVITSGLS